MIQITHGGAFYILENFNVKNIIIGIQVDKYENCTEFIKLAKQKRVKIIVLQADDVFKIDKSTQIRVLFPDITNVISNNKINNNSLVFRLEYENFKMLFTGDIEEYAEKAILSKYKDNPIMQADVLKVAHHGSKTSSTIQFLNTVKPQIALIGVGENNTFGHPNEEVLERLKGFRNKDI